MHVFVGIFVGRPRRETNRTKVRRNFSAVRYEVVSKYLVRVLYTVDAYIVLDYETCLNTKNDRGSFDG